MDAVICVCAFLLVYGATLRSLGAGLCALCLVGYFHGILRANFPGVFSTFIFDSGTLGLYLAVFLARKTDHTPGLNEWLLISRLRWLLIWPTLLVLVPINHPFVQLVGLRAAIWFLPMILVGARARPRDLVVWARGLACLNLLMLGIAVYQYFYGIEGMFPQSTVTLAMFRSADVAGAKYHRLPATFANAHSYGVAMLLTVPILVGRGLSLARFGEKLLIFAGLLAALFGVFLCAARYPVVLLVLGVVGIVFMRRFSLRLLVLLAIAGAILGYAVVNNERLQRSFMLLDTDEVMERVELSVNSSIWDLMIEYPMGNGLGGAWGTSIPPFLVQYAPKSVGLENELSRILIEQGLVGVLLWVLFLGWLYGRLPHDRSEWKAGIDYMYCLTFIIALTSISAAGALTGIPGAALTLLEMGIVARSRIISSSGGSRQLTAPHRSRISMTSDPVLASGKTGSLARPAP